MSPEHHHLVISNPTHFHLSSYSLCLRKTWGYPYSSIMKNFGCPVLSRLSFSPVVFPSTSTKAVLLSFPSPRVPCKIESLYTPPAHGLPHTDGSVGLSFAEIICRSISNKLSGFTTSLYSPTSTSSTPVSPGLTTVYNNVTVA